MSLQSFVTHLVCHWPVRSGPKCHWCNEWHNGYKTLQWKIRIWPLTILYCLIFNVSIFLQYGHFFPDPQYENVQHIICCDSFATYAYDFDFTHADGFSRYLSSPFCVSIHVVCWIGIHAKRMWCADIRYYLICLCYGWKSSDMIWFT